MPAPDYEQMRDNLLAAYNALSAGTVQSYEVNGRRLTYKDTAKILEEITHLNSLIAQQTPGGARTYAVPKRPSDA